MKLQTEDWTQKNIGRIGELFPNVITEKKDENGKIVKGINFELLRQELSEDIVEGEECYDFTWVGKRASIVESNTPIRKTLRPVIEDSKDWENTGNLYIEGDNLEVLKLLQESYLNSVKMIYIDPPYNTGKDFIYTDNRTMDKEEYEEEIDYRDEEENINFKQNTDTNPRFHSDWCSMMYPRLKLARNLLQEDGVIFISIDDNEAHNLRKICDEIFGEENYIHSLKWKRKKQPSYLHGHVASVVEYVLIFSKNKINLEKLSIHKRSDADTRIDNSSNLMSERTIKKNIRVKLKEEVCLIKSGVYKNKTMTTEFLNDVVIKNGRTCNDIFVKAQFRNDQSQIDKFCEKDAIFITKNYGLRRDLLKEELEKRKAITDLLLDWGDNQDSDNEMAGLFGNEKPFNYPKPLKLILNLAKSLDSDDFIVLDFFAGSSTTAHSVLELNKLDGGKRKYILVQLPENLDKALIKANENEKNILSNAIMFCDLLKNPHTICEIGKERIRRAGAKIKEEVETENEKNALTGEIKKVPDIGFRVLRVDDTNMKDVYYAASEYEQNMLEGLVSNVKEDRSDLDLLYGIMLDWGLQLSLSHKMIAMQGFTVHMVDEGSLVACFAEKISEKLVREIASMKPLRVVFRDSCFAGSPEKINVEEIFKTLSPETSVRVI